MRLSSGSTRLTRWLLVAAWLLVIFGLSSLPGSAIPSEVGDYSPIAHFVEYAVLGGLVMWALGPRTLWTRFALAALLACSLYAVSDEFHQSFVPGRTPDPVDWATDTVGAAVATAAIVVIRRRRS
jgi:VanZ family protein